MFSAPLIFDMFFVKQILLSMIHNVSFSFVDEFWLIETPSIIENIFFKDSCSSIRSFGFMFSSVYNILCS